MSRLLLLCVAVAGACATQFVPFRPVQVPASEDTFERASKALIADGATIEQLDEEAGLIVTKWEESAQFGSTHRVRWVITVASGVVTIDSQCQSKMSKDDPLVKNEWASCGNQPTDRNAAAEEIADRLR